jgi:hypothetical protein
MARVYVQELVGTAGASHADDREPPRRFGSFAVVSPAGRRSPAFDLWEHDSWADLAQGIATDLDDPGRHDALPASPGTGPSVQWTGLEDRILVAHPDSPGVEAWQQRGGTDAVAYLHEVIDGPPGMAGDVCDTVVHDGAEDHRRFGVELVGAWRTAMRADDQVVAIWSLPSWDAWAVFEAAADGGDVEFFHLWQRLSGQVHRRRRVLLVDAELSPLRTGGQPMAEDLRPPPGG